MDETTEMRRKEILVVEDDPAMRSVLVRALVAQGAKYRVMAVDNGADAEDRILTHTPDLVIMDIMLPYKSGVDICVELKADPQREKLPILLITSLADESSMSEKEWKDLTRADSFLPKPFAVSDLIARVDEMLANEGNGEHA